MARRTLLITGLALLMLACQPKTTETSVTETNSAIMQPASNTSAQSVYDFKMKDIDGKEVDLSMYQGKVLLIVNVASQCGLTPQYQSLEQFYEQYKDKGVVVLGFPANNFGGQEPGTEAEIKQFCSAKFNVTFPMFSKISVKGSDIHPLYKYLTETTGEEVQWNFQKFLVGKDGKVIKSISPRTVVLEDEVVNLVNAQI
jgi:glutathione peroxidase